MRNTESGPPFPLLISFIQTEGLYNKGFEVLPEVLEDLGRSGRLVGIVFTIWPNPKIMGINNFF